MNLKITNSHVQCINCHFGNFEVLKDGCDPFVIKQSTVEFIGCQVGMVLNNTLKIVNNSKVSFQHSQFLKIETLIINDNFLRNSISPS
jgi:hypothetical protein